MTLLKLASTKSSATLEALMRKMDLIIAFRPFLSQPQGMKALRTGLVRNSSKDQILAAARRLLRRQGYRQTSMDDIAIEAGLAKATLYLHFSGKSAIVRTILQQCRAEIDARAELAAARQDDLVAALAGVVEAHLGTAIDWFGHAGHMRELHRLVAEDPESFRIPPKAELDERLSGILARAVAQGLIVPRQPDAARVLMEVLADCANGAKQREAIDGPEFGQRVRLAVPVILAGLFKMGEREHAV